MPMYEISKWVVVLSECMVSLLGMFMISRYVFLEPSLEDKKQKVYYIISFSVAFLVCLLFGNDLASILSMIFCGVNIIIGRSKGKIRGVFNIVPICGFLNGLLIPVLVVPVQLFRLQERYLIIYSLIFYGILAIVLLLFYFKGKNWRKTFKEELKFRQFQTWEKILLWVVGIILMVYFFALSTIPEVTEEEFRSEIYQLMLKHYIVTGLVCFVLSITIIILIMQGNKRSFYFEKALRNQKAEMEKEKAEAANKAKSNFLSSMSHEIRTPMNAIVGMTEVLLRGEHSRETVEYLNNIKVSGDALLTIINDILDFSKIESGKMDIVEGKYSPRAMINALKMIFENRAAGKPIELLYDIDENIPAVLMGDEHRLRQIIINLVNNAIKFTDRGFVKVSVKSEKIDEETVQIYFSVQDTGIGIKEEDLPKLFGSFQQVDVKKNHKKEGTGLGLAISKQLVELMKGTIGIKSQYGEGSTFYFEMPQTVVAYTMDEAEAISLGQDDLDMNFVAPNAHILLADDNELNRKVAIALLEPFKMNIELAVDGRDALDKALASKYDLVFLDHMMPELDGVEVCREIRKQEDEYYKALPIVALTANATFEAREMFLSEQMNDFVAKPIQMSEISRCIRKWLPAELIEDATNTAKPKMQQVVEDKDDKLLDIEGIDLMTGLKNAGSKQLFIDLLTDFYKRIDLKSDKLEKSLAAGEIKEYTIEVHALKSTARMIGAIKLSEMSYELEMHGKAGEVDAIREKSPAHLKLYRSYKDKLKAYAPKTEETKSVSYDEIKEVLKRICEALDDFDLNTADEAMVELASFEMPEDLINMRQELSTYLANVDMEEGLRIAKDMLAELEK